MVNAVGDKSMNGRVGVVKAYLKSRDVWKVEFEKNEIKILREDNLLVRDPDPDGRFAVDKSSFRQGGKRS